LADLSGSPLQLSTDPAAAAGADATIFMVPTRAEPGGAAYGTADLVAAARDRARAVAARGAPERHLFIIGSTVMPGALAGEVRPALAAGLRGASPRLAYSPEFVALGDVIAGYRRPDVILVGAEEEVTGAAVAALYARLAEREAPVEILGIEAAEIAKISLNAYLCLKISFGNALAGLAGDSAPDIARAIGHDRRIGGAYLKPGMPYGGPCFPRDVTAFLQMAEARGQAAPLLAATEAVNARRFEEIADEAMALAAGRPIAVLGLSFKAGTPVTDASPGLMLARRLATLGVEVVVWDPDPEVAATPDPGLRRVRSLAGCAGAGVGVVTHPAPDWRDTAAAALAPMPLLEPWTGARPAPA
ncbi:MAG: hypothetical protein AAFW69_12560, partial [Pseudomonadota bacterium]